MIHVDVRQLSVDVTSDVVVEVSNDGAPWYRLVTLPHTVGTVDDRRKIAEEYARIFADGARYVANLIGSKVRITSHGYAL